MARLLSVLDSATAECPAGTNRVLTFAEPARHVPAHVGQLRDLRDSALRVGGGV